ncbi:MAG: monovalent cation/H(+) antiporter subunit G [Erysipelotrichia bacterium]|jgi:multicomponent Na+:H+ antiporter subunit G|nr:monovalent cation/H(+) antiporter subunit G [Erysipelotrichia bacterium]
MSTFILEAFTILSFVLGLFFFLVGSIGLIRLPDAITRLHATTKADTLGAGFIILGFILRTGFSLISLKLVLIIVFIWLTNPTGAHLIGKIAYEKKEDQV